MNCRENKILNKKFLHLKSLKKIRIHRFKMKKALMQISIYNKNKIFKITPLIQEFHLR